MIVAALLLAQAVNADATLFQKAQALAANGKCSEALPSLTELASRHSTAVPVLYALGRCQFETGDWESAALNLTAVAAAAPDRAEVRFYLGSAYVRAGKLPHGIEQLEAAVELDPNLAAAWRVLGIVRFGERQLTPGTRTALEKAVALDPVDARAHYWLGAFLLATKENEAARQHLARSLELQPEVQAVRLAYGQALMNVGETAKALTEFEAVDTSFEPLLGKAKALQKLQRLEDARAAVVAALALAQTPDQRRPAVWVLSRIERALGREAQAAEAEAELAAIDRALDAKLSRFRELQAEAMRLGAAGDPAAVVRVLEEAVAIEARQDSLTMLGDAYTQLGRLPEAESAYLRAMQAGTPSPALSERLRKLRSVPR